MRPTALALDADAIYFVDGKKVFRFTKNGAPGSQQDLTQGVVLADAPSSIAVDATFVYFTTPVSDKVWAIKKDGSSVAPLVPLATGQTKPTTLVVDNTAIYWTTQGAVSLVVKLAK